MSMQHNITLSVPAVQVDAYMQHGFDVQGIDTESAGRINITKIADRRMYFPYGVGLRRSNVVPFTILRPQTRYDDSGIFEALHSSIGMMQQLALRDSLDRMSHVLPMYSLARTEAVSICTTIGRRFALRIFSRYAADDLVDYINLVRGFRDGTKTDGSNYFTRNVFDDKTLPSVYDVWWDTTHDAIFTFDKNYATRLPQQLMRAIESRK